MIHDIQITNKMNSKTEEFELWKPGQPKTDIDDIEIVVFENAEMTERRRYEVDFKWDDDWIDVYNFHQNSDEPSKEDPKKHNAWEKYTQFCEDWYKLEAKAKIPKWYKFDPRDPFSFQNGHNSLKAMDPTMFSFLKSQEWKIRDAEQTKDKKNKYTEKSEFVVDCGQLLGIGGEAVVIRKAVAEKIVKKEDKTKINDRDFEALKIIPMMKHNFESEERLEEMQKRVNDRHENADIEKEFMKRREGKRLLQQTDALHRLL